jgi:hypothetical protein
MPVSRYQLNSLMAFNPTTKTWIVMRVPYPMGLYERGWTDGST